METFKMGYYREIEESDLCAPLPEHKSSILGDMVQAAWEKEVQRCRRNGGRKKPSLWKVILRVFGQELILYGLIVAAVEFLIRLQQPLFLGLLLRYYSPVQELHNTTSPSLTFLNRFINYYEGSGAVSWGEAVFFAFGVVFCSGVNVMVQHPYMMGVMHIGMKMRVAMCSLIYRKALKVNLQAMSESSAGLVVNLMANDVNRFDTGPLFIHYLWIGPLETIFMVTYIYREMGMPAVYGSLVIILLIPYQIYLGLRTANYRESTAVKADERVKLMKEIIMGISVIKMYTWETPFRNIVDAVRREEVRYIRMTSYIRGIIMSFIMFTSRFAIFVTVLLYVTLVKRINVECVFFLTCYYNVVKQTMTIYFPQAVGQVAEMGVAIQRIRDYLLSDECDLPAREPLAQVIEEEVAPKKRVVIRIDPVTLESRTSQINVNEFKMPIREKVINKDVPAIKFENTCSKWIVSDKRDNVEDVNLEIPTGSLTTIVGSVGSGKSTLLHIVLKELPCTSGSVEVKGSVSYASQDTWLFLGSVRQNILFGQPFKKSRYMEVCKVCALERDISLFPHGDKTVVGERGVSLSGGQRARINLARAIYKEADIYLLDDPLSAVDSQVAKHIFEKCIKKYLEGKTVVLITHQLQFIKTVDQIVVMEKGKLVADGDYEELQNEDLAVIRMMQDESRQVTEAPPPPMASSTSIMPSAFSMTRKHWSLYIETSDEGPKLEAEHQVVGRVSSRVYTDYFAAGSRKPYIIIVILAFILAQISASASDYWISQWSHVEDRLTGDKTMDNIIWTEQGLQRMHYVVIFGLITVATIFFSLFRAVLFFTACMKSSICFHDKMFECISRSPMSFFHANSSGRILNRFSKDMGAVDELLPQAMIDCCQIMLNLIGVIIVILLGDITLLVPTVAIIIIFYIMRHIYIRTTGAVKRLEGITRSPVFSHLNATVLGLPTIRSFGAELLLIEEFDRHQDLHSSTWYLFISCSRAFGFYLDIICLVFIVCVTFSCLMKTGFDGSSVGLVITQSISLTGVFQWGMRQSAEMENQMTSVERILEYTDLPQEDAWRAESESNKPPRDWPQEGRIILNDLTLRYKPDGNAVLHKLFLEIKPREKIGIVGRTGAGKSSLIQALFRMAVVEGSIIIDGIDTNTIGLHDLREQISIIPQEPVLFSGSLRKNLDPFNEYTDEKLLEALSYVEILLDENDDATNLLDKEVAEGGCNFSVGERQLVCLARAIINKHKILVLDEATANVDVQTDALIQMAIREHFRDCTVLTVAHRLNTVIDSDKILVLDAGRLLEFDHPYVLLQNRRSNFSKMVAETGPTMAPLLYKAAAEV